MCLKKFGISLRRSSLLLLLFFLFLPSSLAAMSEADLTSNLQLSITTLTRLENQFTLLTKDLEDRNQQLLSLQTVNQDLNNQLTELQALSQSQQESLTSLARLNQELMATQEQSMQAYNNLNLSYQQLSQELRQKESSNIWGITLGVLCGIAIGLVGGWAIATF